MLSFLPKTYKKEILTIYRFKIVTAIFVCLSFVFIIALVGLLPSYVNEKAQADELRLQLAKELTPEELVIEQRKNLNQVLIDYLAKEIKSFSTKKKTSEIIKTIISIKSEAISLQVISFNEKSISLSGISATRNDLIIFQQDLKKNVLFEEVKLPISDITKSIDAPFTIDIILK